MSNDVQQACPSTAWAYLSVPDPAGAKLRCGLSAGHTGPHEFHMTWTDSVLYAEQAIRDAIAAHLASRRSDPDFMRRLRERIEQNREILDQLAGPPCICDQTTARLVVCPAHPERATRGDT